MFISFQTDRSWQTVDPDQTEGAVWSCHSVCITLHQLYQLFSVSITLHFSYLCGTCSFLSWLHVKSGSRHCSATTQFSFIFQMGLGKTLQAISVAYYYRSEWPLLIIVPSSLRYSWIEEFEKWLPDVDPSAINLIQTGSDARYNKNPKISVTKWISVIILKIIMVLPLNNESKKMQMKWQTLFAKTCLWLSGNLGSFGVSW